jgi:hypothetical protein
MNQLVGESGLTDTRSIQLAMSPSMSRHGSKVLTSRAEILVFNNGDAIN